MKDETKIKNQPTKVNTQNLYQLNLTIKEILENAVDGDGVISIEAFEKINALGLQKDEVVKQVVFNYKTSANFVDNIDKEIKRLNGLKERENKWQEEIKKYLTDNLEPGTKIENEYFTVRWTKSSKIVENDMFISLEQLLKINKKCVRKKITLSLDKKYLTVLAKAGKPLPEGISYITKNNLTIK